LPSNQAKTEQRALRMSIFAVDNWGFGRSDLSRLKSPRADLLACHHPLLPGAFKFAIINRTSSHAKMAQPPAHLVSLGQSLLALPRHHFYFYSPSLPGHSARPLALPICGRNFPESRHQKSLPTLFEVFAVLTSRTRDASGDEQSHAHRSAAYGRDLEADCSAFDRATDKNAA
jgi:hypothetical protein